MTDEPRPSPDAELEAIVAASAAATGVPFRVVSCDPELADTAAFCASYGYALEDSANTILVGSKADPPVYVACVALATTRLDVNGTVRKRMGARKVSFAPAGATVAVTGMVIGGVTPFGLPDGLPIWIDAAVMARPEVIVGGGSRSTKLLIAPAALAALGGAEIVDGLAIPTG